MIKIENVVVSGWEAAIRGMRNPMNSWSQSDSHICNEYTIREEMPCQMIENDNEPCKDCNDGKYGYCVGKICKLIETLPYSEVITGERDAQAPEAD